MLALNGTIFVSMENFINGMHVIENAKLLTDPKLFNMAGVLQPMPAAWWDEKPREAKMVFGHHHGIYAIPTRELIAWLGARIARLNTIEIGAGNGAFCSALGITGTDNFQQLMPKYKQLYEMTGQPIINYGAHVENLDAIAAVRKYKPQAVLASWVTHKYDPRRPELGGNEIGVDEHKLLSLVDNYFFIGNSRIHHKKPILRDMQSGRIKTHKVVDCVADNAMLQSRSSGGFDFVMHIQRIPEVGK